jgi:GTP-binding protein
VRADIPGPIEGAHDGHGLGDRFLKHVERTRVLVHLISLSPEAPDPVAAHRIVLDELAAWSPRLAAYPQIVVLNKIDLIGDRAELDLWREELEAAGVREVSFVSGLTSEGVEAIMTRVAGYLEDREPEADPGEPWSPV